MDESRQHSSRLRTVVKLMTGPTPRMIHVQGRVVAAGGLALLLVLTACDTTSPTPRSSASAGPEVNWSLVWSDDFDGAAGTRPAAKNWTYRTGIGYPGGATQWGTGELEHM